MDGFNNTYSSNNTFNPSRKSRFSLNFKKLFPNKNNSLVSSPRSFKKFSKKSIIITSFAFLLVIGLVTTFKYSVDKANGSSAVLGDQKIQLPNAKKTQNLSREFTFPLKNEKGDEVSKFKFIIENAELRDEIVVKGQKATAIQGRTFLIINLKVVNEHNQAVQINTRDYVRLTINDKQEEMLAPDIHNDPVEVQAISTKFTRVGFPISDTDKNLKLHIGEIKGNKTTVDLNFK